MRARGGKSLQGLTRRGLLLGSLALATAACTAPAPAPARPTVEPQWPAEWGTEARAILAESEAVAALWGRYAEFRLGTGQPPTPTEWLDGTRRATGLLARTARFHDSIATSTIDSDTWRDRRVVAAQSQRLKELATALVAYRAETDRLSPGGDGTRALPFLENARSLLEQAKADWA